MCTKGCQTETSANDPCLKVPLRGTRGSKPLGSGKSLPAAGKKATEGFEGVQEIALGTGYLCLGMWSTLVSAGLFEAQVAQFVGKANVSCQFSRFVLAAQTP